MRPCPICNEEKRKVIEKQYTHTSIINNNVKADLSMFECSACGHHYLDGDNVDQGWFDWYYVNKYQTDDKPYSNDRLNSLADLIAKYANIKVLDIGGMDGELQSRIYERRRSCDVVGVGGYVRNAYNAVVLSHTLEHIYDIPAMFAKVKSAMQPGGLLFIEVPVHLDYKDKEYDKHWQHIQKFRPQDLECLLKNHGFTVEISQQLPDYREYRVWRIVGIYV